MTTKFLSLAAAVIGLCTFTASGFAQTAAPSPTPTPPVMPGTPASPTTPGKHGGHMHHPAIHAAIRSLERAKEEMLAANHDFGGHKADAIAACDAAIAQLQMALQYAGGTAGAAPTPTP